MLEVCLRLNVKCVSAYAFSIENFKRPEEEVSALMKLAEEKLMELSEHGYVALASQTSQVLMSSTVTYWTNMGLD
jgi:undecaprenyl diphosphate synthase